MTQNPAKLATTASRSDTSKKPITTKNTTMTEGITTVLLVALIALTCALLMEHWQKKQQRKHWQRYVDAQAYNERKRRWVAEGQRNGWL